MAIDRKATYWKDTRTLRDGQVVTVLRCLYCHAIVTKGTWDGTRSGIKYRFQGVKCTECGTCTEESYILLGNP